MSKFKVGDYFLCQQDSYILIGEITSYSDEYFKFKKIFDTLYPVANITKFAQNSIIYDESIKITKGVALLYKVIYG